MEFYRVVEITDEQMDVDPPEYAEEVKDPLREVIVELVYQAGNDGPVPEDPVQTEVVKFALEAIPKAPESEDIGAILPFTEFPPIPFNKLDE